MLEIECLFQTLLSAWKSLPHFSDDKSISILSWNLQMKLIISDVILKDFIYCRVRLLSAIWPPPIKAWLFSGWAHSQSLHRAEVEPMRYHVSHHSSLLETTPTHCCIFQQWTWASGPRIFSRREWESSPPEQDFPTTQTLCSNLEDI